jgi:di/tricarboxylate transporter
MQEVELGLIVTSTLAILVVLALRTRTHLNDRPLVIGAILGIVPGILGALIVLVPRTDLIPDSAEPFLWLLIGLVATAIVLIAVSVGYARR